MGLEVEKGFANSPEQVSTQDNGTRLPQCQTSKNPGCQGQSQALLLWPGGSDLTEGPGAYRCLDSMQAKPAAARGCAPAPHAGRRTAPDRAHHRQCKRPGASAPDQAAFPATGKSAAPGRRLGSLARASGPTPTRRALPCPRLSARSPSPRAPVYHAVQERMRGPHTSGHCRTTSHLRLSSPHPRMQAAAAGGRCRLGGPIMQGRSAPGGFQAARIKL